MAVKKTINSLIRLPGTIYHYMRRRKLINKTPTIIASDCFATFIYHDMGLKFNSPTINLFFSPDDFIKLVSNLSGFMESDVIEVKNSSENYPQGMISYNGEDVVINFMHYSDFISARDKWNERKKRIDYSNIFIIQTIENIKEEQAVAFDKLPYKNKMLITNDNPTNSKNIVVHRVFSKRNYYAGKILNYKFMFCPTRYMDDIDYISFLNENQL